MLRQPSCAQFEKPGLHQPQPCLQYYCESAAPVLNSDSNGVHLTPFLFCLFAFLDANIKSTTQVGRGLLGLQ